MQHVTLAFDGPTARITINRPEKRNAIALATVEDLQVAVAEANANTQIRVIVLTGAGDRAFASGADLDELGALSTPHQALTYDAMVSQLYDAFERSRKPIIARIQAHAIGGGCLLALACDVRVASDNATFGVPAARIGLMLSAPEHALLVNHIGASRAKLLLASGRRLSAKEAESWRLVDIVAAPSGLDAAVDTLANDIAANAPLAVAAAKRLVQAVGRNAALAEAAATSYAEIYGSADLREGLAAVKAKRKPSFAGR
ncbi:MAG: enoyl-CoA hydratase/isomerase family protein [Betaproteobacteria bacterium]|nr:enoyl-CoA hydratase/isomerase family protein [Betaproteobacteria bacterium]